MIKSFWDTGDYPILIDPTDDEVMQFTEKWDTLRICTEGDVIAIGSGYGNTHQSIIDMVKRVKQLRRWHPSTYILYHCLPTFYFNLEDVGGPRESRVERVLREDFTERHRQIIQDLINIRY